jgi:hypothetical protein
MFTSRRAIAASFGSDRQASAATASAVAIDRRATIIAPDARVGTVAEGRCSGSLATTSASEGDRSKGG